jgi:DNA-directed RNA polymerase I subunit RPA1
LNLDAKSKLPAKEWGPIGVEEGDVIIRDNELLQGTLDKNQFGASEFGMVHAFYEVYGSEKAGELLTSLARIFTVFLQTRGFTCGLDDLVLTPEYNKQRRMLIEESHKEGVETAADFVGLKNYKAKALNYSNRIVIQSKDGGHRDKEILKFTKMALPEDPFEGKQVIQSDDPIRVRLEDRMNQSEDINQLDVELDSLIKSKMSVATSAVLKLCIPDGLVKRFPLNNISAMCLSGAKGGIVNMTQISCMLG